jgi:membrane protein YdbS with pleckstrin-like domain
MESNGITTVAAIVAVVGIILLLLGAVAYFKLVTFNFILGREVITMIAGLAVFVVGAVGLLYAKGSS